MLIGNITAQGQCASLIQNLFQPILSLFLAREYDPEFISQLLYVIYTFLFHGIGMEAILGEGQVLMRIIQLESLRQINDDLLTLLRETDDIELAENIKESKFYRHNKKWLTQTEGVHQWVFEDQNMWNQEMLDPRMWESEDDYD